MNKKYNKLYKLEGWLIKPDEELEIPECEEIGDGNAENKQEGKMLIDVYCASVATVGGDGYREYVIYEYSENEAVLKLYRKNEGGDEICDSCLIPASAVDKINGIIKKYGFKEWNGIKNPASFDGKRFVVKFCDGGEFYTVSSDNMPEDGAEKFDLLQRAVAAYMVKKI